MCDKDQIDYFFRIKNLKKFLNIKLLILPSKSRSVCTSKITFFLKSTNKNNVK